MKSIRVFFSSAISRNGVRWCFLSSRSRSTVRAAPSTRPSNEVSSARTIVTKHSPVGVGINRRAKEETFACQNFDEARERSEITSTVQTCAELSARLTFSINSVDRRNEPKTRSPGKSPINRRKTQRYNADFGLEEVLRIDASKDSEKRVRAASIVV
jgi:hypothetical protein